MFVRFVVSLFRFGLFCFCFVLVYFVLVLFCFVLFCFGFALGFVSKVMSGVFKSGCNIRA